MISEETIKHWEHAAALECGDSSPLSAGDLSPSNCVVLTTPAKRQVQVARRAARRGAAWATSRPSKKSGDKSPHSKAQARRQMPLPSFIGALVRDSTERRLNFTGTVWCSEHASALECADLSPLLAGDLSPSNCTARTISAKRQVQVARRAAVRGAAWATSRPSGKSGDKSPHSKARRRVSP